jgi:hypothetical protein
MLEALGDHRQPPVNPTVRLIGDAEVAHAHALRRHGPPAQAAAILLSEPRDVRGDSQRLRPVDLQPQACRHLLENGPAEPRVSRRHPRDDGLRPDRRAPEVDEQRTAPGQAEDRAGTLALLEATGEREAIGEGTEPEGSASCVERQIDCQLDSRGNWAARVAAQEFHVGERRRSAKHLAPHDAMVPANQPRKRGADRCQFVSACAVLGEDVPTVRGGHPDRRPGKRARAGSEIESHLAALAPAVHPECAPPRGPYPTRWRTRSPQGEAPLPQIQVRIGVRAGPDVAGGRR